MMNELLNKKLWGWIADQQTHDNTCRFRNVAPLFILAIRTLGDRIAPEQNMLVVMMMEMMLMTYCTWLLSWRRTCQSRSPHSWSSRRDFCRCKCGPLKRFSFADTPPRSTLRLFHQYTVNSCRREISSPSRFSFRQTSHLLPCTSAPPCRNPYLQLAWSCCCRPSSHAPHTGQVCHQCICGD